MYIIIEGNIKLFITSASHLMLVYLDFLSGFLNTKSLYSVAGVRWKKQFIAQEYHNKII